MITYLTSMLYKNIHRINPDDLISITYKLHGTSGISSRLACKRKLTWYNRIGKFLGFDVITKEYDYIYASRKVIKNEELNPNAQHFYNVDIWGITHDLLKEHLQDGMTFYYEVVGYLPTGGLIQKDYDYGYEEGKFGIYIYRITYTNIYGKVFEFSAKQVQDFCNKHGLNAVPQLYYGYARDVVDSDGDKLSINDQWHDIFLEYLKKHYNDRNCFMCKNQVPEEGIVLRIEKLEFEAYKQKSNRFYERETKLLDKGESNIEDDN